MANSSTSALRHIIAVRSHGAPYLKHTFTPRCNASRQIWTMARLLDEVTEAVGGKRNVEKLKAVSRDFRSEPHQGRLQCRI